MDTRTGLIHEMQPGETLRDLERRLNAHPGDLSSAIQRADERTPGSVSVPRELFGWLVEYALELRGAWFWKANSTHRNCETMTKLDNHLKEAIALRDSPNAPHEPRGANDQRPETSRM